MVKIEVEIQGLAPGLLMHKFSAEAEAELESKVRTRSKDRPGPREQADKVAYRMEDGTLYQPAEHIFQAMVRASTSFQVKGSGKKTYLEAVKGNLVITPEYISHNRKDFDVFSQPVRIQRARVMRHRPLLKDWKLSFVIEILDEDAVPFEVANQILINAGQTKGIGDFRPRYGRFVVTKFQRVS